MQKTPYTFKCSENLIYFVIEAERLKGFVPPRMVRSCNKSELERFYDGVDLTDWKSTGINPSHEYFIIRTVWIELSEAGEFQVKNPSKEVLPKFALPEDQPWLEYVGSGRSCPAQDCDTSAWLMIAHGGNWIKGGLFSGGLENVEYAIDVRHKEARERFPDVCGRNAWLKQLAQELTACANTVLKTDDLRFKLPLPQLPSGLAKLPYPWLMYIGRGSPDYDQGERKAWMWRGYAHDWSQHARGDSSELYYAIDVRNKEARAAFAYLIPDGVEDVVYAYLQNETVLKAAIQP